MVSRGEEPLAHSRQPQDCRAQPVTARDRVLFKETVCRQLDQVPVDGCLVLAAQGS